VNRALTGHDVWSYHAVNVAIHAAAALALFGAVRRTLSLPTFAGRWRQQATAIGFATALLWAVHPVQTESVTYIVQRAESLMGMWFLLAFYGFARAADGGDARWHRLAIAAGYAAALSKEIAVAIPVLLLFYDRAFLSDGFRAAWRARGKIHAALFGSWLIVAALVAAAGSRGGTVGFGSKVAWLDYAWTQVEAIALYLRIGFWPAPLIFDYGVEWIRPSWRLLPDLLLVVGLVAGTLIAAVRWPKWGFLGLWFLAMLAPTSLIPGNRQTIAEHRVYLSLAAPLLLAALGVFQLGGVRRGVAVVAAVALGSTTLAARRNLDYRSEVILYADTAAKRPGNGFAHYNLGKALAESGLPARALDSYRAAIRLEPGLIAAHYNLGNALAELGRHDEAVAAFERALALEPRHARSRYNLANSFVALGRRTEARDQFAAAVGLDPELVEARANLAGVLLELGEVDRAATELTEVLRRDPHSVTARFNLAQAHRLRGRFDAARTEFERALQTDPGFEPARAALLTLPKSEEGRNLRAK
jgi:tetratricopeptide (TPR) repeat protein